MCPALSPRLDRLAELRLCRLDRERERLLLPLGCTERRTQPLDRLRVACRVAAFGQFARHARLVGLLACCDVAPRRFEGVALLVDSAAQIEHALPCVLDLLD